LRLTNEHSWIAACSRKDRTRCVVAEVEGAVATTAEASAQLFKVISEKKLGVFSVPDVKTEVTTYLAPGCVFFAIGECTSPSDGREYLQLACGYGWVPKCSRKNENKIVVAEVEQFLRISGSGFSSTGPRHPARNSLSGLDEEFGCTTSEALLSEATSNTAACERKLLFAPGSPHEEHDAGRMVVEERFFSALGNDGICEYTGTPGTPEKLPRKRRKLEGSGSASNMNAAVQAKLTKLIARTFAQFRLQDLSFEQLFNGVTANWGDDETRPTINEFRAEMKQLEMLNKVMTIHGRVFLIS